MCLVSREVIGRPLACRIAGRMDIRRRGNFGGRMTTMTKTWTAASRQRCSRLLVLILSACSLCLSGVDAYSLRVRVQPGRAVGGEPFLEQPQVEILEGEGGDIDVFFEGFATAELISSPTGYSSLQYDNVTGGDGTASLVGGRGRATFSGLFIDEAGEGFVCRFVAFNAAGLGVAWVDSNPFDVGIGEPYKIALSTPVGTMKGGERIEKAPVVAVQDKGGNVVGTYNEGLVTASLVTFPGSGALLPSDQVSSPIRLGYAYFDNLVIKEAGIGYRLGFTSTGQNSALEGGNYVESEGFTVGIGPAHRLEMEEDILDATIVSGSPFVIQPRIAAYDLGDNMLRDDGDSAVLVSVLANSASATLRPTDSVFEVMSEGVATFGGLSLDRSGRNIKLQFSLYSYDRYTGNWSAAGVNLETDFFHVEEGRPTALNLEQEVDGAWAGGRGFKKQPYLTVVDAGGGIVTGDSDTMVSASVTSSLMVNHDVIVNTSSDPLVHVTRVYSTLEDGTYGVGQDIPVTIAFSAPVYVKTSQGRYDPPYLCLGGTRGGDGSSGLPAVLRNASSEIISDEITFTYTVESGDTIAGATLEVEGLYALKMGAVPLVDLLARDINVTLPTMGSDRSLSYTSALSVDSAVPVVTAISSSLEGGEYGVGQVIPVWINFSFPVVVIVGTGASPPLLPLGGFYHNGGASKVYAEFVEGSGTSRLLFEYTVREGDSTNRTSYGVTVANGPGNAILLPSNSPLSFVARPSILQKSSNPSLAAVLSLEAAPGGGNAGLGIDGGSITVDTTPAEVDPSRGIEVAGYGNGTYTSGEEVYLRVWFTKPVSVFADVGLFLATGTRGARADYISGGNGTEHVTFVYHVVEGDSTPLLDIYGRHALDVGDGGYFRRHSTDPTQEAYIDLAPTIASGKSLADTSRVALDGSPPRVISVSLAPDTGDNAVYGLGDVVGLVVTFDKDVTLSDGSPVLVLDCKRMREAFYEWGNGSTTLHFLYQVQMGDSTTNLGYRFYPNALCLESGCPDKSTTTIRQKTSRGNPGAHASLTLPNSLGSRAVGVPVGTSVTVDTSGARATHVVGITTSSPGGSYGAGQSIDITIEFSDEVLLSTSSHHNTLPTISLNNGGEAVLVKGTGTREWLFSYDFLGNDGTDVLLLDILKDSFAAINCQQECRAWNWNGAAVDLSLQGLDLSYAGIQLDATPPKVVELYSPKETSPWGGVYTVGEEIEVCVVFDRSVVVTGSPRLQLDTGAYAVFDGTSEDGTEACFLYVVGFGDHSTNITWAGQWSLGANGVGGGGTEDKILRRSTNPLTRANLSLPNPVYPLARGGSTIYINTTGRPQVINITSPNMAGIYAPGDVVTIWVTFDQHVSVIGKPIMNLNTGRVEPGRAHYVQGSDNQTLIFEYEVIAEDLTDSLALSDRHALKFGFSTIIGSSGNYEIRSRSLMAQASTNPTVAVERALPFYPGEEGSLSFNSDIGLDGSTPHIQSITFAGPSNATYVGGDVVQILVQFSAPVVVAGNPTIKLETGTIDREALWVNTSRANTSVADDDSVASAVEGNHSVLLFEYTVVTGDSTNDLDYWSDEENWRDARASFIMPAVGDDGNSSSSIKRLSTKPSLDADVHLNPSGGELIGTDRATSFGGWVYFRDLLVRTRGQGYKLNFEAFLSTPISSTSSSSASSSVPPGGSARGGLTLKQSALFEVGFSVEFEVMSDDSERSDSFGRSISLDGSLLLAGAPRKHLVVPEVQLIVSTGAASKTVSEVQMIAVDVVHIKEIQRFITYADPYERVGGHWSLEYPGLGRSRNIPADATIEQVQTVLEEDFPSLGRILVVREEYVYCACDHGYIWTVTFDEEEGDIRKFVPDPSRLIGTGANVTEVEVLQDSPVLGGTFTMSYTPWSPVNVDRQASRRTSLNLIGWNDAEGANTTAPVLTTRPLLYNASALAMTTALSEDLNLTVSSVIEDCCDEQMGRKWTIEFGSDRGDWNINALTCDASRLKGNRANCWQLTGRDGEGPIIGEFRVKFRESEWTAWLAHDATAGDVEAALLGLQSVDDCRVTRTPAGSAGQHVWTVTFIEVRKRTGFGFAADDMGNMPAMEVDASRIRGTEANVEIRYSFGGEMDYAPWERKQMGSYGEGAGAAYVFSRSAATEGYVWEQDQKLLGSDTGSQDAFGHSVAIDEKHELLVVGAPYAEDNGVPEVQAITCSATTGTFTLSFRGFTSAPISANASLYDLYTAVRGPFGSTDHLHSFPEIDVTERFPQKWKASYPAGLCTGNNSALLSFRVPKHDYWGGSGNLDLLTVDASLLEGEIAVVEVVKGTVNPGGPFSQGVQKGAAYVFRRSAMTGLWYEEKKLFLDDGEGIDRYGWQVVAQGRAVTNDYVIVSAPGRFDERGSLHVYIYSDSEGEWSALQTITGELWSLGKDKLGSSLSMNGDTLAAGGIGYNSSAGVVYMFTASRSGVFQADQRIEHPEQPRPGDRFGESVSLFENFLVIGCPGREDRWLHVGTVSKPWEGEDVGAVYVYRRDSAERPFYFFQKLEASNVKPLDRFGVSVSMDEDAIIVGSHQEFEEGKLAYQRAVQVVTVQSDPGGSGVGNTYRLGWKEECVDDDDDSCEVRWTRKIETDATGVVLKNILEEDFGMGVGVSELVVARSGRDTSTGGYQYTVIFLEESGVVPQMLVDDSEVSGSNAHVRVENLNEVPRKLRGVTHVFVRQTPGDIDSSFREQCFLYPWIKQRQDLFGINVAVSGQFVAVSAPNRDTIHGSYENQNLTSLNSGAVEVFNLNFLTFRFDSLDYSVLEGETLSMNISRSTHTSILQAFNIKSIDRNADQEFQDHIAAIYDLSVAYPDVPITETVADVVGAGTATARSQYYGSANNGSLWLGGMFDYRGLSDYTPIQDKLQFLAHDTSVMYLVNTTDDNVVETPDEGLIVALYVPGMFPSFLGDLIAKVKIEDNGDGEGPYNATASWGTEEAADSFTTFMDKKTYVSKLEADESEDMNRFGGAVDSAEEAGLMIVGNEFSEINGSINCGSAHIFRQELGAWEQEARLVPGNIARGAHFGQAVQIGKVYGTETYAALVGAPGQATVYVFEYNARTRAWEETQTLLAEGNDLPKYGFGGKNRLSLRGNLAAVGAPGAEAVFLYRRSATSVTGGGGGGEEGGSEGAVRWAWERWPVKTFVSSDLDYDVSLQKKTVHRQDYGAAISLDLTSRTLAVGSPLADYDKLGSDEPEAYDTRPSGAEARARGKVYVYHSEPAVQAVTLGAEFGLSRGTFMLSLQHRNEMAKTTQVSWNAPASEFKEALEALSNLEEIEVTKHQWTDDAGFDFYRWMVSFASEFFEEPPLLVPLWKGNGCGACVEFSSGFPRGGGAYVNVSIERSIGEWEEQAVLQASDRRSGDRFGSSVALDKETIAVGAEHSSALAETTWDFETGDLVGWSQTGDAFALQPTYGDNPYFRKGQRGSAGWNRPSKSRLRGRYFVGTYEARPGAGATDFINPSPDYYPGRYQGDGPTGTLLSETFTIGGVDWAGGTPIKISFLVGGGCDDNTEYIELIVDGVGVAKATGACMTEMRSVSWDVSLLAGRAGQVRIVDASSSSPWGHINVDEIDLSWESRGGLHPERQGNVTINGASKAHYIAREDDTSRAGAVYIFSRVTAENASVVTQTPSASPGVSTCPEKDDDFIRFVETRRRYYCPRGRSRRKCVWEESARLTASDRRGGDMFGAAISIHHESGLVVIGAPGKSLTGLWQEPPTVYTTTNPQGDTENAFVTRVPLPMDVRNAKLLRLKGAYGSQMQVGSGAPSVWKLQATDYALQPAAQEFNSRGNAQAGAVYVFLRVPGVGGVGRKCEANSEGDLVRIWHRVERFKLQAHDAHAADHFGSAVSFLAAERALFVGAPYSSSFGHRAGAMYQFDLGVARVFFAQAEFSVEEGKWRLLHEGPQYQEGWKATVTVKRDIEHSDDWLTVQFATSDLTARGIDSDAYRDCSDLAVGARVPSVCGDYEQTAGELTFEPGQTDRAFFVRIMDDHCRERYPEYVQLSLSIPGGPALQGQQYLAKLRIDDDDREQQECA